MKELLTIGIYCHGPSKLPPPEIMAYDQGLLASIVPAKMVYKSLFLVGVVLLGVVRGHDID